MSDDITIEFALAGEQARMARVVVDQLESANPDADVNLSEQAKQSFIQQYLLQQYQQIVTAE